MSQSTISAFALSQGHDRRTVLRRVLDNDVQPVGKDNRKCDLYLVAELARIMADKATKQDPTSTKLKNHGRDIDNKTREFKLAVLQGKYMPRDVAKQVFTQFILAAKTRSLSGVPRLVTLVRMAADTTAAIEIAKQEMTDIWAEMATGEWAKK